MKVLPIIIPTWNRLDLLKQTIDTAEKNTDLSPEIIVVDDNSSDGTQKYLKKRKNIKYHLFKERKPLKDVSNQGAKMASPSDFICFSNDDVYFTPHWDTVLIKVLNKYPDIGIVGGKRHPHHRISEVRKMGKINVLICEQQAGYSQFMRRKDWDELGPFYSDIFACIDIKMCEKFLRNGFLIASVEKPIVFHCGLYNWKKLPASDFGKMKKLAKRRPDILIK